MTDAERRAVDADPLWTDDGQVLWLLEQAAGTDELSSVSTIAAELGCQPPVVVSALRKLEERGDVASRSVSGRKVWGTAVQIHRMDVNQQQIEADRVESAQRIADRNRDLEKVRRQLAASLGGRGIEVTTVSRLYPSASNEGRIDQLLVTTDDPDAVGWLLGRLSDPR